MSKTRAQNLNLIREGLSNLLESEEHNLRDRQHEALLKLAITDEDKFYRGYFNHATGVGKTMEMATLIKVFRNTAPDQKIILLEENVKIIEQTVKAFNNPEKSEYLVEEPENIGIFNANLKDVDKPIIVATYASLKNLLTKIDPAKVGLVLPDEAHKCLSDSRMESIKSFQNACIYAFTATPKYDEKKNLKNLLENELDELSIVDGIKQGLNCSVKNILLVSDIAVDLSQVKKNNHGDYDETEFNKAVGETHKEEIKHKIVEFYDRFIDMETGEQASDRQTMINCTNMEQAKAQSEAFNEYYGWQIATYSDSSLSNTEQKKRISDFENKKYKIMVQVDTLGQGYDYPELYQTINYPTGSFVREAQRSGRPLRLDPKNKNKKGWVVDVVFRHPEHQDDEIIVSANKNRQTIFAHVTGKLEILSDDREKYEKALINKRNFQGVQTKPTILEGYKILSTAEEYFKIEAAAQKWEEENYVPEKTEWMKSAPELNKIYYTGTGVIVDALNKCVGEYITDKEGTKYHIVIKARLTKTKTLVLNGTGNKEIDKNIFDKFTFLSGLTLRAATLTGKDIETHLKVGDLQKIFIGKPGKILNKLKEQEANILLNRDNQPIVDDNGDNIPISIAVSLGRKTFVLNKTGNQAIDEKILEQFHKDSKLMLRKETNEKTTLMKSVANLEQIYIGERPKIRRLLKELEGHTLKSKENEIIPIVIKTISGGNETYNLNGSDDKTTDDAINEYFEKKTGLKRKGSIIIKTEHMHSIGELRSEYLGGERKVKDAFEIAYGKMLKNTEGKENIPLIIYALAGGAKTKFLNGTGNLKIDKMIREQFEKETGLKRKDSIVTKTEYMQAPYDLDSVFIGGPNKIRTKLIALDGEILKDSNNEPVLDIEKNEIPLVINIENTANRPFFFLNGFGNKEIDEQILDCFEKLSGLKRREQKTVLTNKNSRDYR